MNKKPGYLTIFYTAIILFNIVTVSSPSGILLTAVETLFVIGLLYKHKIEDAFFWHTVFTITCLSATNAAGMDFDNTIMYSYARLKLIGPIGLSYVISIFVMLSTLSRKTVMDKKSLFYKMTLMVAFLLVDGVVIGIAGVLFSDYYSAYLLNFFIYSVVILINCICFIKCYNESFLAKVYHHAMPLLSGACISSLIAFYCFGVSTSYGGLDNIVLVPDLTYYGILLLFLMLTLKNRWVFLGLVSYIVLLINGLGGKQIVGAIIGLFIFLYYVLSGKQSIYSGIISKKIILMCFAILGLGISFIIYRMDIPDLSAQKLAQAFDLFFMLGDLQNMATSPYVRVASFLNIMNDGLHSPFNLLFGQGYGGYFTDSLNLLYSKIDMYGDGGFPYDAVLKHKLPTAHDTFVMVPLLNGIVGLLYMIIIVFRYMRKMKYSPYVFVAVLWLFLVYYFNTQLAITGIFFLFAAEFDLRKLRYKKEMKI